MQTNRPTLVAYTVIIFFTLASIFFAYQAKNFEIDASAETLLEKDNTPYIRSQILNQRFGSDEFILIAFEPKSGNIFSEDTLNLLQDLITKIEVLDRVDSVLGLPNIPLFEQLGSINTDFDPASITWQSERYNEQTLINTLTNHPIYEGLLINEEQTATALQVVFKENKELIELETKIVEIQQHLLDRKLSDEESEQLETLQEQKKGIVDELNTQRNAEIDELRLIVKDYSDEGDFYFGGGNLLAKQLIDIIQKDLVVFGLIITLIIAALLFIIFRRIMWVALPLICCAASVLFTVGLLGALKIPVTIISANVVALQIILTLALIVHLIVQFREYEQTEQDESHSNLITKTIKEKFSPCLYAGLTTSIGFGSLIFSGIQPVISFGWMMIAAMIVTLFVSLLLFPALLLAFSGKDKSTENPSLFTKILNKFVDLASYSKKSVVWVCGSITALGIVGCLLLTAENSFLNYFDDSTEVYKELSFIDQNFGGSTAFDIIYTIPEEEKKTDLVITADAIASTKELHTLLAEKEAIGNITSIVDFTEIASVVAGKPLTEYELSVFYQTVDDDVKKDLFASYFSDSEDQIRISTRVQDTTKGLDREAFVESIRQDIEALGIDKENYELSNLFIIYQDILARLVTSQFTTLGIVYIVMALVLVLIFRSVKVALICLIPNLVTTAAILGTMGLLGIPMDLMTITIAAVAMGISVDDTIHYVHRYTKEIKKDKASALKNTHLSVGYALIYTTLIIVVGFSSLIFSNFIPSMMFGLLTTLAMAVALLTDLSILPVLLNKNLNKDDKAAAT